MLKSTESRFPRNCDDDQGPCLVCSSGALCRAVAGSADDPVLDGFQGRYDIRPVTQALDATIRQEIAAVKGLGFMRKPKGRFQDLLATPLVERCKGCAGFGFVYRTNRTETVLKECTCRSCNGTGRSCPAGNIDQST